MDKDTKFIKTLCKRIRNGKFAWEKYQNGGCYCIPNLGDYVLQTQRMVCSYGLCGFDLWFPHSNLPTIQWDWDLGELIVGELDYKTWLFWKEHYMEFWNEWADDMETDLDFTAYVKAKHDIEVPKKVAEDW